MLCYDGARKAGRLTCLCAALLSVSPPPPPPLHHYTLITLIAWLRSESHCACLYNTHAAMSSGDPNRVPFLLSSTASSLVHITSDPRFCLSTISKPPTPCASIYPNPWWILSSPAYRKHTGAGDNMLELTSTWNVGSWGLNYYYYYFE